MAHVNQDQGIGEYMDFLTKFHNISNKLKKSVFLNIYIIRSFYM